MIITILSIILLAIGLFLAIYFGKLHERTYWTDAYETLSIVGIGLSLCAGLVSVTACASLLMAHSKILKEDKRTELTNTISSLNNTYDYLSNISSSITRVEVVEYNEKVKEYKSDVAKAKNKLSNPWVNWFVCPVYNEFTGEEVRYIK